jgi:TetR/AcrR family transcriptional regulator, regulator of cefoperazone and chloramphenicol sensitivity
MTLNEINKPDARERIIKAVLYIIGKKSDVRVTVREISARANVNLAAVNYYFRTKEKLFDEIEKYFFREVFEANKILDDTSEDPYKRILRWAKEITGLISENPGIIWIISNKVMKKEKTGVFLNEFIHKKDQRLIDLIRDATGISDEKILAIKSMQIITGTINPLILFYGFKSDFNLNLDDPDTMNIYLEKLIKSILKA